MKNNLEIKIPEGINGDVEDECIGGCDIKKKNMFDIKTEVGEELERDLEKLREYEKENPKKIKLTKEDKQLIKQQKKIGKDIDNAFKREKFLRDNIDTMSISDYTKILYRLPLTKKQMKDMYVKILDDAENNNLT